MKSAPEPTPIDDHSHDGIPGCPHESHRASGYHGGGGAVSRPVARGPIRRPDVPGKHPHAGQRSLVWVDRAGQETPLGTSPRQYRYPRISPDGTRVSVDLQDQQQDTWIWDLAAETLTRLTLDPGQDQYGEWVPPDGQRVIFASSREGLANLFWRAADGTGSAERLFESEQPQFPQAVAPDGSVLVVRETRGGDDDLLLLPLSGDSVAEELLATEFRERNAAISPDGNWFAYKSDASGAWEVYVRPFPDADAGRFLISTNGGTRPVWAPDGSELFYVINNQLFAVPVETDPTFSRHADAAHRRRLPTRRTGLGRSDV